MPICCISGFVVAEVRTGSGRRTPEKDGVSQLFREQLLGFYKVALRRSEAVTGQILKKSTFLCRNVPEVSLRLTSLKFPASTRVFSGQKKTQSRQPHCPLVAWHGNYTAFKMFHVSKTKFPGPSCTSFKWGLGTQGRKARSYDFTCNPARTATGTIS